MCCGILIWRPRFVRIFCATANPVEVIVAETEQGRGVLGVIDGSSPKGVEAEEHVAASGGSFCGRSGISVRSGAGAAFS